MAIKSSKLGIVAACLTLAMAGGSALAGKPNKPWKSWFPDIAMGYSLMQSDAGDLLDDDFYIDGGVTYWPEAWKLGINMDLAYASYDLSNSAIDEINTIIGADANNKIDDGDSDIWSLAVNGVWGPESNGKFGWYLTAGIGVYFLDTQVNTTGLVYYPPICGWYWCVPGGVGSGSIQVASESSTEFGWNAGVGIDLEVGSNGSQVYLEARYTDVQTDVGELKYIPIVVGFRW